MTPGRLFHAAEHFQLDGNSSAPAEQLDHMLYKICVEMLSCSSTGYIDLLVTLICVVNCISGLGYAWLVCELHSLKPTT
jgi:hypothetical protein